MKTPKIQKTTKMFCVRYYFKFEGLGLGVHPFDSERNEMHFQAPAHTLHSPQLG